jgi:hypothetical protein
MEGISYRLDTVYGAPDFDSPGGAVQAAAKLAVKIDLASRLAVRAGLRETEAALLIHDAGQGHFALWLAHCLSGTPGFHWVLSGRNILALGAARAALIEAMQYTMRVHLKKNNHRETQSFTTSHILCVLCDPFGEKDFMLANMVPDTWEGLASLCAPGGIVIAAMASAEAERFDRKKHPVFTRLGDIKRKGFRALAYQRR